MLQNLGFVQSSPSQIKACINPLVILAITYWTSCIIFILFVKMQETEIYLWQENIMIRHIIRTRLLLFSFCYPSWRWSALQSVRMVGKGKASLATEHYTLGKSQQWPLDTAIFLKLLSVNLLPFFIKAHLSCLTRSLLIWKHSLDDSSRW